LAFVDGEGLSARARPFGDERDRGVRGAEREAEAGKKTPSLEPSRAHRSGPRRRETPLLRVRTDGSETIDARVLVVSVMGSRSRSDASRVHVSESRKANREVGASPRKTYPPLAWR
jgi:hypothetical protein